MTSYQGGSPQAELRTGRQNYDQGTHPQASSSSSSSSSSPSTSSSSQFPPQAKVGHRQWRPFHIHTYIHMHKHRSVSLGTSCGDSVFCSVICILHMYICVFICTYISGSAPPVAKLLLHLISWHHFSGHRLWPLGFLFPRRTRNYVQTSIQYKQTYMHTYTHLYVHMYVHTYTHMYTHRQTYWVGSLGRNWVGTGSQLGRNLGPFENAAYQYVSC